ncbi:uncharacterized protein LOC116413285 isoform X2 [Galleria mellonella]|uniref:Uncharacterized protein LOC116413285 isoform X2 n=1 Tax=Galleria mellonella TaxID=7137 RepID=A0A6J3C8T3_GALME|nr:uncharacterized protein LOC116413285 isoform X2 [Galleria mellonella]
MPRFLMLGLIITIYLTTASTDEEVTSVANKVDVTTVPSQIIERSSHHHKVGPSFHGFWKKKLVWRPRWVKTWQEKKIFVAVWKKMWSPAVLNEWVPIPKPPPGWIKYDVGGYAVKNVPY